MRKKGFSVERIVAILPGMIKAGVPAGSGTGAL